MLSSGGWQGRWKHKNVFEFAYKFRNKCWRDKQETIIMTEHRDVKRGFAWVLNRTEKESLKCVNHVNVLFKKKLETKYSNIHVINVISEVHQVPEKWWWGDIQLFLAARKVCRHKILIALLLSLECCIEIHQGNRVAGVKMHCRHLRWSKPYIDMPVFMEPEGFPAWLCPQILVNKKSSAASEWSA